MVGFQSFSNIPPKEYRVEHNLISTGGSCQQPILLYNQAGPSNVTSWTTVLWMSLEQSSMTCILVLCYLVRCMMLYKTYFYHHHHYQSNMTTLKVSFMSPSSGRWFIHSSSPNSYKNYLSLFFPLLTEEIDSEVKEVK